MILVLSFHFEGTVVLTFKAENARIFCYNCTLLCLTVGQGGLIFQSLLLLLETPPHEVLVTQDLELGLIDLLLVHELRRPMEVLWEVVVVYYFGGVQVHRV